MIYHICPPDTLFVKHALDTFENIKAGFNKCIIIISPHHKNWQHNIENKYIKYEGPLNPEIIETINSSKCEGIVLHTLNDELLELALSIDKNIPIFWRSWGADLHDILYPVFDPYEPETKKIIGVNGLLGSIKTTLRPFYRYIFGKSRAKKTKLQKKMLFMKRINTIATVTDYEYQELQRTIKGFSVKNLSLMYLSVETQIIFNTRQNINANKIMIGHSSYPDHNHSDVFKIINGFRNSINDIVVPLSYGDSAYREKLIDYGRSLFKKQFIPIVDFKPIKEYSELVNSCFAFILNSKIQSGVGNIVCFLLQGSKVYLHEENPVYLDYIKGGIKIFSVQKDMSYDHLFNYRLSEADKKNNYRLVNEILNYKSEIQNIRKIYDSFGVLV